MKLITVFALLAMCLSASGQNLIIPGQNPAKPYKMIGERNTIYYDPSNPPDVLKGGVEYLSSTPENDTVYFSSEQPATLDQVSITFQTKTNQDTIWIDWGEDTPVRISGTTDQTKTSDYSTGSTTYSIKIYGDIDKITKFSVNETYVTFGAMSNNIGKMTGLTYLYLRDCSGVATCASEDIPAGLTYWYWRTLPKLTATINSEDIPVDLTFWYWLALPNLTATINSADIPVDLTTWYWSTLPNLTANGLSITALSKALTLLTMKTMTLATERVDELLLSMDTYYVGANLMTENATITLNGTGVGAPTDGKSNTNIVSLISKATLQGKTWTFEINTP